MQLDFEGLKVAVRKFESLQSELSEFGATDTEPRGAFVDFMVATLAGDEDRVKQYLEADNFWELYSSKKGYKRACDRLNTGVIRVMEAINAARYPEVQKLANYYGWGVC